MRLLLGLALSVALATPSSAATKNDSASDSAVRLSILNGHIAGQKGYLSPDPHWLQLRIRINNIGKSAIKLLDVREKLADGTTVASARSIKELAKPPGMLGKGANIVGTGITSKGKGIVIPFAGPMAGLAEIGAQAPHADSEADKLKAASRAGIKANYLAPASSVEGEVWIPSVTHPKSLVFLYELDGKQRALEVTNGYQ